MIINVILESTLYIGLSALVDLVSDLISLISAASRGHALTLHKLYIIVHRFQCESKATSCCPIYVGVSVVSCGGRRATGKERTGWIICSS